MSRLQTVVKTDALAIEEAVLRVGAEPCEYLDERSVHALLTDRPDEYYAFVLGELRDMALGRIKVELPPKQVFTDPGGVSDFRVMPCVLRSPSGVRKTVKVVGTNAAQRTVAGQITVGKAFLVDPVENFISHIFDGCLLSSARTGVCAAVAVDVIAARRDRIAVIGAGRVGYYAAFFVAALGGVKEVVFQDIDRQMAENSAALLSMNLPGVRCTSSATGAQEGQPDVVILATTSRKPVLSPGRCPAGLVISLGADADSQSELDPAWAAVSDVFVDTLDSARFGDLRAWKESGLMGDGSVTDLLGAIRGPLAPTRRPRVFVSTGSALFDNLTIGYLVSRSKGS